ncbi:transcription factor protein [Ciona intestinalis]
MLVSQFREANYENFQSGGRRVSGQRSPPKMSVSSYSTSSSPSSASPSVDLGQAFNMENCDNIMLNMEDGNSFSGFESLQNNLDSVEVQSPPSLAQDGTFNGIDHTTNCVVKNSQPVFNQYSMMEPVGGYDHASYSSGSPVSSNEVDFSRNSSTDVFVNDKTSTSAQQQSTTPRKSFEHVTDKELRKKLKNRESAQAARDRKKAKMLSLERQISELLERNRIVETENQELRSRIQRMESESLWRMGKQEAVSDASPSFSGSIAYHRMHDQTVYPSHCEYNGYPQHTPQPCLPQHHASSTSTEKHSLPSYSAYAEDGSTNTDYTQPSYVQNLWRNEGVVPNNTQVYPNGPFTSQQIPKNEIMEDAILG